MAVGPITNPTTPIAIGTVATPTWASDVEDNINQGLFNSNTRSLVVPAYAASSFAAAGTLGGWSDAGLVNGYLQTAASSNYLLFNISGIVGQVPTGSYGQAWGLNSISMRMKTSGTGVATLNIQRLDHQSSNSAVGLIQAINASAGSTSGTGDQFVTVPVQTPPYVFDADHLVFAVIVAGNSADRVYSITINYQNFGL